MAKSTVEYPQSRKSDRLDSVAEELTLSLDPVSGEYTKIGPVSSAGGHVDVRH